MKIVIVNGSPRKTDAIFVNKERQRFGKELEIN